MREHFQKALEEAGDSRVLEEGEQARVEALQRRRLLRLLMDTEAGCLEWTGRRDSQGYGLHRYGRKLWRVHRLVWHLYRGPILEGVQIHHICGNRICAALEHLDPVINTRRRDAEFVED